MGLPEDATSHFGRVSQLIRAFDEAKIVETSNELTKGLSDIGACLNLRQLQPSDNSQDLETLTLPEIKRPQRVFFLDSEDPLRNDHFTDPSSQFWNRSRGARQASMNYQFMSITDRESLAMVKLKPTKRKQSTAKFPTIKRNTNFSSCIKVIRMEDGHCQAVFRSYLHI